MSCCCSCASVRMVPPPYVASSVVAASVPVEAHPRPALDDARAGARGVAAEPTPPVLGGDPAAAAVVDLVNQVRQEHGLAPVVVDPALEAAANGHAAHMAAVGQMAHDGIGDGTMQTRATEAGFQGSRMAENVAAGQQSPEQVMQSWMQSPGHRANVLDPALTSIGVGVEQDAEGQQYWSQSFGG